MFESLKDFKRICNALHTQVHWLVFHQNLHHLSQDGKKYWQ